MLYNIMFWNIRSVNSQNAFEKSIDLKRRHQYTFIALFEPFQGPQEIDLYRRRIRMQNAKVNCSGKIWLFWKADWEGEVVSDTIQ